MADAFEELHGVKITAEGERTLTFILNPGTDTRPARQIINNRAEVYRNKLRAATEASDERAAKLQEAQETIWQLRLGEKHMQICIDDKNTHIAKLEQTIAELQAENAKLQAELNTQAASAESERLRSRLAANRTDVEAWLYAVDRRVARLEERLDYNNPPS